MRELIREKDSVSLVFRLFVACQRLLVFFYVKLFFQVLIQ